MKTPLEILQKYWGHDAFRPKQESIIQDVLARKDILALLATGGGKSICYQVPALLMEGVCIVVSPLIALMEDQVQQLNDKGIQAKVLSSALSKREVDILLDNARFGNLKFLYVSPERLQNRLFQERFKLMNVSFIAVDEAHCISEWGHDFRPSYRQINILRELKPEIKIAAFTGTATKHTVSDIQEQLHFQESNVQLSTFGRANLSYNIFRSENKLIDIINYCKLNQGSGIIYCKTRKEVKMLATYLIDNQLNAAYYHGGLSYEERKNTQKDWTSAKKRIMVCTNAFGMGIDKSDVRFVLHYGIPETIEAYFQEAGRAGRDGKIAHANLYYEKQDLKAVQDSIQKKYPDPVLIKKVYNALGNHFQLAFGSGLEEAFNFNLLAFCDKYNFELITTFNCIKIIENAGIIGLSDGFNTISQVQITCDKTALYNEQVRSKETNSVLQFLLRTQMGIFERKVNIDELKISQYTKLATSKVIAILQDLENREFLVYNQKKDGQTITYLTERLQDNNLPIDWKSFNFRKDKHLKQWDEFAQILATKECTQTAFLKYFGELQTTPCGICKNCKALNNQHTDIETIIRDGLNEIFNNHDRIKLDDFLIYIQQLDKKQITEVLRNFQELNLVHFDATGQTLIKP